MPKLANRTALVTGGGRGIGRAIALAFAREGARVAVSARTAAELQEVVNTAAQTGGKIVALTADLSEPQAARALFRHAKASLGPIDILVNNAGIGSSADPRPVVDFDDAFWELTLRLNLTAPYLLS